MLDSSGRLLSGMSGFTKRSEVAFWHAWTHSEKGKAADIFLHYTVSQGPQDYIVCSKRCEIPSFHCMGRIEYFLR